MRKIILLFLVALLHLSMQAQELTAKPVAMEANDLAASTYEREKTYSSTFGDSILSTCRDSLDRHRKTYIVGYLSQVVTSFDNEGLDFLPEFLGEVADCVSLKTQKGYSKRFIKRIKEHFGKDTTLVVSLDDVDVVRHPIKHEIYGATFHIDFINGKTNDGGYMFMLWDFHNENHPQIHVRTWQPDVCDADRKSVKRIPKDKVFSLHDFDV